MIRPDWCLSSNGTENLHKDFDGQCYREGENPLGTLILLRLHSVSGEEDRLVQREQLVALMSAAAVLLRYTHRE